jgi:hypothetical protein
MLAHRHSINKLRSATGLARRLTVPKAPGPVDNGTDDYLAASWMTGPVRLAMRNFGRMAAGAVDNGAVLPELVLGFT